MLNWLKNALRPAQPSAPAAPAPAASLAPFREQPQVAEAIIAHPRPKRSPGRPKKTHVDANGQPTEARFNHAMRSSRSTSELIGIAKAIIVDQEVSRPEVGLLVTWFDANPEAALSYPGNVLARRLERILEDDVVDAEELEDLAQLLGELTGASHGPTAGANAATTLPLDQPQPELVFEGHLWVFTGKMAFGPRKVCEMQIRARGGDCGSTITQKTNYLVIGTIGSRDWYHTTHGWKIEQAVSLREQGIPIAIIGEDQWAAALDEPRLHPHT